MRFRESRGSSDKPDPLRAIRSSALSPIIVGALVQRSVKTRIRQEGSSCDCVYVASGRLCLLSAGEIALDSWIERLRHVRDKALRLRRRDERSDPPTPSTSERLSGAERAALIAEITGRPLAFLAITEEQLRTGLTQVGLPLEVVNTVIIIQASFAAGAFDIVTGDVERLGGRSPKPLRDVLVLMTHFQGGDTSLGLNELKAPAKVMIDDRGGREH